MAFISNNDISSMSNQDIKQFLKTGEIQYLPKELIDKCRNESPRQTLSFYIPRISALIKEASMNRFRCTNQDQISKIISDAMDWQNNLSSRQSKEITFYAAKGEKYKEFMNRLMKLV